MSDHLLRSTAPADSESRQLLLEAIDSEGTPTLDTEDVRDMLWLIDAHAHLQALPRALAMIQSVLTKTPPSWRPVLEECGVARWTPAIDWILRHKTRLAGMIGEHFARETNTSGNNPMMGSGANDYPLYAMLCAQRPAPPHRDAFELLVGHLLVATVMATREYSQRAGYEQEADRRQWKPTPNAVITAARVVRTLALSPNCQLLDRLPVGNPPEEFAEAVGELPDEDVRAMPRDFQALQRFIQKSWATLEWVEGHGGGGGGSGGHRWIDGRVEVNARLTVEPAPFTDCDDPDSDWGTIDVVKFKSDSVRKLNAHEQSDLSPDEDDDEEEIILSDFDCRETKRDVGALARAAKSKARHVSKSNQLLPWNYPGLAMEETAKLLAHVRERFVAIDQAPKWDSAQRLEAEILTLVHAVLWTGSKAARAANAHLVIAGRREVAADLALVIPEDGTTNRLLWRIKALEPSYKTAIKGTAAQIRGRKDYLYLPDLIGLGGLLQRLASRRGKLHHNRPLFSGDKEALVASLKCWLKDYSPSGRVTLHKLEGALWSHLHRELGDPALASCVTGTPHPLARVRLFYTTPHIKTLQEAYRSTVERISALAYTAIGKQRPTGLTWTGALPREGAMGARLCPTRSAVRDMFARLKADIRGAADYVDRAGFIVYHNLYTLYTLQYFAYATTCRAIVTPLLHPSEIDSEHGTASLSDKDDESRHKTRLIWIPDGLRAQMSAYSEHLAALRCQMPRLPAQFQAEPCFFLDEDFSLALARPKLIERWLAGYLDVKANSHRRFLRTELLERRCPSEIIDAFMGHWYEGEDPFNKYSSFCFADYLAQLRCHLLPLLEDIGPLGAVRSRLVR